MCGIAGIISPDPSKIDELTLSRMGKALAHRGPDGNANWINRNGTTGFAHRRLAVIDTTPAAAQPMHYLDRFTIVYNGEIYNYIELKSELIKHKYVFHTSSDTEVILAAYAHYRENCISYFDGMFAFAIWDDVDQILFCARDRFGEKPFYYLTDDGFYFASEIKALKTVGKKSEVDKVMLLHFLTSGITVDPSDSSKTFTEGIKKLPASHWLKYNAHDSSITIEKYWDVSRRVSPIKLNEATEKFLDLLTTSIKRRLRSDVTLGTSLSGGLDSSTIAAIISGLSGKHLKTFTASFPGFEKDEGNKAAGVAHKFQLLNFTTTPTALGLIADIEKLSYHQDEPFASASVYAQYMVFRLAAEHHVTVLLDGQGADEICAGYDNYRNWPFRTFFPQLTANLLRRKQEQIISNDLYLNREFVEEGQKNLKVVKPVVRQLNDLLYFNTFCLGLEELLRYADRNSMAHGREVRLPFLNFELVEFIFSLPSSYKIHRGYTKWINRKLMEDILPHEIVWTKRKTGFEPPQKSWMESRIVSDYIVEARNELVSNGILNKDILHKRVSAHEAYKKNAREWRWLITSIFINKKGSE